MGFEFDKRGVIEVCGKSYDVDVTDTGFIEGVTRDFRAIFEEYQAFRELQARLAAALKTPAEDADALAERLVEGNRRIAEHARGFIIQTLGAQAYETIFAGRRPNSVEHIQLCNYIYCETVRQREDVIRKYVDPPQNRRQRRDAAKTTRKPKSGKAGPADRPGLPAVDGGSTAVPGAGADGG